MIKIHNYVDNEVRCIYPTSVRFEPCMHPRILILVHTITYLQLFTFIFK